MSFTPEQLAEITAIVTKAQTDAEARFEALFEPLSTQITTDLQGFMSKATDRLDSLEAAATDPQAAPEGTPKDPLASRVTELEAQLQAAADREAAKETESKSLRFDKALSEAVDAHNPLVKDLALEVLGSRYKGKAEETDKGFLVAGKTIQETLGEFFKTPAGLHLLPPTAQPGADTKEAQGGTSGGAQVTTADALAAAFL